MIIIDPTSIAIIPIITKFNPITGSKIVVVKSPAIAEPANSTAYPNPRFVLPELL